MNEGIKVLLVGDDEAVKGLGQMLHRKDRIIVTGAARSSEEALAAARKLSPDVILVLTDAGTSAIDTACAITEAQLPARVIIVAENIGQCLVPAIKAGAAGLLPRNVGHDELVSAIRKIHRWCLASSRPGNPTAGAKVPRYLKSG